jgi:hypothetical protein
MTRLEYRILLVSSIVSLLLAGSLLILSIYKRHMELEVGRNTKRLEELQADVRRGNASERILKSITQDLEPLVASKPLLNSLLTRYGINVRNPPTSSNP